MQMTGLRVDAGIGSGLRLPGSPVLRLHLNADGLPVFIRLRIVGEIGRDRF